MYNKCCNVTLIFFYSSGHGSSGYSGSSYGGSGHSHGGIDLASVVGATYGGRDHI